MFGVCSVLKTAPLHGMDPFYLTKLQLIFNDLFIGLRSIPLEDVRDATSRAELVKLHEEFAWQTSTRYAEDVIVSESMSGLLHKYMMVVHEGMLTKHITDACPGWPWLLTFIDTQLAKQRANRPPMHPGGSTVDSMLAQLIL